MQPKVGDRYVYLPREMVWFEVTNVIKNTCVGFWAAGTQMGEKMTYPIREFDKYFRLERPKPNSFKSLYDKLYE